MQWLYIGTISKVFSGFDMSVSYQDPRFRASERERHHDIHILHYALFTICIPDLLASKNSCQHYRAKQIYTLSHRKTFTYAPHLTSRLQFDWLQFAGQTIILSPWIVALTPIKTDRLGHKEQRAHKGGESMKQNWNKPHCITSRAFIYALTELEHKRTTPFQFNSKENVQQLSASPFFFSF